MRIHPAVIVAVVVLLAAIGGGGAYFYMSGVASPPPKIVEFIGKPRQVAVDGDAMAMPQEGSAIVARLQKGLQVDVVGLVEGRKWAEVTLPDKRLAYVAADGLTEKAVPSIAPKEPPPSPPPAVAPPPPPQAVAQSTLQAQAQPAPQAQAEPVQQPVFQPTTQPSPPANPQQTPPPTAPAPSEAGVAGPAGGPPKEASAADVAMSLDLRQAASVAFDQTADVYTAPKPVPVFVEPNIHAPQKYQIEAGTRVPAIQRSTDGVWVMASTEDDEPAYLLAGDLGEPLKGKPVMLPPDGDAAAAGPSGPLPDVVEGPAHVLTTSSLEVGGQPVTLAGLAGEGGAFAQQFQAFIDSQGGELHCARQDQAYQCILPSKIDVALSALFYGTARPTPDAPLAYQNQAKAAQAAARGVWQH